MAFNNNALISRLDELRSGNPPRIPTEGNPGQSAPFRYSGSYMTSNQPQLPPSSAAETPNLQRRFTADMSKMSIAPIGELNQNTEPLEVPPLNFKKAELLEKKRQEQKELQRRREQFQAQMDTMRQQEALQQFELEQMTQELQKDGLPHGYQSEPTTPPEYRDQVFPSTFSARTNRYSSSSLTSPPGLSNRSHRSGSQLTSPPSELTQSQYFQSTSEAMPSKSVPGSRRGSNDRVTAYVPETNGSARRAVRYSMPTTGLRSRTHDSVPEHSASMGLGSLNTTSFLFDDEEKDSTTSPGGKNYIQLNDDNFPILHRDSHSGALSASSAALDLAPSQSPGPEARIPSASLTRHRLSEQLIPSTSFNAMLNGHSNGSSSLSTQKSPGNFGHNRQLNRHSMEASLAVYSKANLSGQTMSNDTSRPSLATIHPSYSTNDVPTLKNAPSSSTDITPPKTQAQQHFHNHNASLGRIPPNALSNRHSRELSGGDNRRDEQNSTFQQLSSALQASAAPFGPPTTASSPADTSPGQMVPFSNAMAFQSQPFYGAYGMQMMNMGMNSMQQMTNPLTFQNQMQTFQPQQNTFAQYTNYGQQGRYQDSQTRIMQQRRTQNGDEQARYNNVPLENLQGEILVLCKDQHGCRYLQKKLEERDPESLQMIFLETNQHVVELMTDPFGNYLCQKLLEYSNNDQRTQLIRNAAPDMVKIALNSHGTRALQKMIDFIETPEQTQTIINALNNQVVDLIQDLNGNHVIQKCLNKLNAQDAEFIFSAVGDNCVTVGTHRHGCCVLQRCIDHAVGYQRAHLIKQITENAFHLVQDPFGNYVLQYIVDLQESCFTDPLCEAFHGQIPSLSKQKFSSNVIEKCLRGAQQSVTHVMIEEMLNSNELEKMLRDSYANYVVQTAMDYGDSDIKARLIEAIRPILPAVRQTPHGRRIQSKMMALEGQGRFSESGTPNDRSSGQIPLSSQMTSSPMTNTYTAPTNGYGNFGVPTRSVYPQFTQPQTQQYANGPTNFLHFENEHQQSNVQQQTAPFARMPQVNGGFF